MTIHCISARCSNGTKGIFESNAKLYGTEFRKQYLEWPLLWTDPLLHVHPIIHNSMTKHMSISQRARSAAGEVEWALSLSADVDLIQPPARDSFSDEPVYIGNEIFQLWVLLGSGPLIVKMGRLKNWVAADCLSRFAQTTHNKSLRG